MFFDLSGVFAGNTAVIKPSAYSPKTSDVIKMIIDECFDEKKFRIKIIDKDKTNAQEPNLIYIQDTKAENIYFINDVLSYL